MRSPAPEVDPRIDFYTSLTSPVEEDLPAAEAAAVAAEAAEAAAAVPVVAVPVVAAEVTAAVTAEVTAAVAAAPRWWNQNRRRNQ